MISILIKDINDYHDCMFVEYFLCMVNAGLLLRNGNQSKKYHRWKSSIWQRLTGFVVLLQMRRSYGVVGGLGVGLKLQIG